MSTRKERQNPDYKMTPYDKKQLDNANSKRARRLFKRTGAVGEFYTTTKEPG